MEKLIKYRLDQLGKLYQKSKINIPIILKRGNLDILEKEVSKLKEINTRIDELENILIKIGGM